MRGIAMPDERTTLGADERTVGLSDPDSGSGAATGVYEGTSTLGREPIGRYDLREEIARGGMGEVYLAVDRTLGRPVAIKILQARYRSGSTTARRFVDEARISGQLQHPGIPPIHDLGTLPDGRPFLAMKLIKGRTLDDLLAERSGPDADRGRFLAAFEQVCQAVAYAHARRVIHRDLKPQNIMVGAFGEVQVMDWGLAKVLGETPERRRTSDSDERLATEILSARDDSDGLETQAGSVLGTPAYMAPEQATGAVDQVDERSDVFGLGGVLAVILTGEPPFVGETGESTRILAARGKVEDCFARLDASGAEPDLVALCKRCLSPGREDRPADAGAIASAVAAFRAEAEERARQAELDRVRAEGERARLEAEARTQRHRRRTRMAVALGLAGLLVVGGAAWRAVRDQAEGRRADAERLASIALGRAAQLATQARAIDAAESAQANAATKLWEQAEATIEQAEEAIAGVGSPALEAVVGVMATGIRTGLARAHRDATLLASLELAAAADSGTSGGSSDRRSTVKGIRSAFEAAGLPAGGDAKALADAVKAERPGLRAALLRAIDQWALALQHPPDPDAERVRDTANRLDPDPIRQEIRATSAGTDKEALLRLFERASRENLHPSTALMLASAASKKGLEPEVVRLLRGALECDRPDSSTLVALCGALRLAYPTDPVALEESVGHARMLVALYPNNAMSHYTLGQALQFAKQDRASAEFRYRKTLELNPRFTFCMINLGAMLWRKGDLAGAEQWTRKAVEVDPKFAMAYFNLFDVARARGDLAGCEALARKGADQIPDRTAWACHNALAEILESRGDLAGAEVECGKMLELYPKLKNFEAKLARTKRLALLVPRLDEIRAGREIPDSPAEAIDCARLLRQPFRRDYASAARLYDRAFAADAKLAEDRAAKHRYQAARAGVLAANGQGTDTPTDPAGRSALRARALSWLRAELAVWTAKAPSNQIDDQEAVAFELAEWVNHGDFASVRPGTPQFNVPPDERAAWESLWADVRATLDAAQKPIATALKP